VANINFKFTGDDFKGLKNLEKTLAKMQNYQARVGVFGGNYPATGESIASVALLHELGDATPRTFNYKGHKITITRGIPTRSFLRVPIIGHKNKIIMDRKFMQAYIAVALADGKPELPIKLMAMNAYEEVQKAFATRGFGKWMPNMNHEYIKLKGSTTPLIDTGLLRSSITYKIEEKGL
jgi:hypothetical protein